MSVLIQEKLGNKYLDLISSIREVCGKSKWKFKMAFAMKGGGGLEGVSNATYLF